MADIPMIAAPVSSVEEVERAMAAGADEVYFGLLLPEWREEFGDADHWSRRQGRRSHVESLTEAREIAEAASAYGGLASLACNARYSSLQIERLLDAVLRWESEGGRAVVVSDLGVLLALEQAPSRLRRHLSLLAGVFNASSVAMFASLGVCRIVLPRELAISEMAKLIQRSPAMEFEALAINQRCPFIDGMCGFQHRSCLPPGNVRADFEYQLSPDRQTAITLSHDPDYQGHGCQLAWRTADGAVQLDARDDYFRPHCAACLLPQLQQAGVNVLKIAGRGYPSETIVRAVKFLRAAVQLADDESDAAERCARIRQLYAHTFETCCEASRCYYRLGLPEGHDA